MRVLRTITTPRAIGFGFAFASAGLLVIACSERGRLVEPDAASPPGPAAASQLDPEPSHLQHAAVTGHEEELAQVREVTARFHRVEAAVDAGYELGYVNGSGVRIITGCVAHPTAGGMGYHYFNKELIDDLVVDPFKPEGLVYAPGPDGDLQLAAVEYVVPGLGSNPPGVAAPPKVFGLDMVILVPAVGFYTLHAWVWRHNPSGMFAHWNPEVVCP
jgi:hypothetical protein